MRLNTFHLAALATAVTCVITTHAAEPKITRAHADGKGKLVVSIVYFAEDTCMAIAGVREGHPPAIEKPKRTPVVTVELERRAPPCEQKLRTLERSIELSDQTGAKSVEVFFVDKSGKFIRSSRPPIERPEDQDEMQ